MLALPASWRGWMLKVEPAKRCCRCEKRKRSPSSETSGYCTRAYYLMSSCYVTACLFFQMNRVRDKAPYLPLNPQDDTDLVEQLFEISLAFGKTGGVYYIVQNTLAEAMAEGRDPTPISYRRFCEQFRDPQEAVWFKQLVEFYLAVGRGKNRDRLDRAMVAITNLLRFLEKYLGGGTAIETRMVQQFAGDEQP